MQRPAKPSMPVRFRPQPPISIRSTTSRPSLRASGTTVPAKRFVLSDALACRPGLWMPRAKAWAACPGTPGRRVRPRTEKDDRGWGVVGDGRRMGSGAPPDDPWMPPIKPARGAKDHCRDGPFRARDCHPPSGPTDSRRLGHARYNPRRNASSGSGAPKSPS